RADAGIGGLVSDSHSTIGANRDVAEIPRAGPRDRESGSECADGARTRHSSSAGDDAGAGAVYNPDRLLPGACSRTGFDGGLVQARAADGEYRSGEYGFGKIDSGGGALGRGELRVLEYVDALFFQAGQEPKTQTILSSLVEFGNALADGDEFIAGSHAVRARLQRAAL